LQIAGLGGAVHTAQVDARDPLSVDAHVDDVVATAGGVDVSLNVISDRAVQGTPMVEMDADEYVEPVAAAVRTFFLTSRAAARVMRRQPSGGVILAFGGAADPPRGFYLGSLQTAFHAVEAMRLSSRSISAPRACAS
jgi:3-oxoacyl-[acyl-carrier protein] reductase